MPGTCPEGSRSGCRTSRQCPRRLPRWRARYACGRWPSDRWRPASQQGRHQRPERHRDQHVGHRGEGQRHHEAVNITLQQTPETQTAREAGSTTRALQAALQCGRAENAARPCSPAARCTSSDMRGEKAAPEGDFKAASRRFELARHHPGDGPHEGGQQPSAAPPGMCGFIGKLKKKNVLRATRKRPLPMQRPSAKRTR